MTVAASGLLVGTAGAATVDVGSGSVTVFQAGSAAPLSTEMVPGAVAVVTQPGGSGSDAWVLASSGAVNSLGRAPHLGDLSGLTLEAPVSAMAATPSGGGYWLAAADGGVFAFGSAEFHGSTGSVSLNDPVVSIASTGTGEGYWLAAADGGVFAFGDADFHGSGAGADLAGRVAAISPTSDEGYMLAVAAEVPAFTLTEAQLYVISMPAERLAVWDRMAHCESTSRWHVNTGNGYYGGLQFSLRSWRLVGGTGYPHEHSREEQIFRGERLLDLQGWGAWPSCSRRLGLR